MFDRDYVFEDEDEIDPNPKLDKEFIVICTHKSPNGKNRVYVGPFTKEAAEYYAESSAYHTCKHKVVQLFDPEVV